MLSKMICKDCGQPIEYSLADGGMKIDCPGCFRPIELPAVKRAPAPEPLIPQSKPGTEHMLEAIGSAFFTAGLIGTVAGGAICLIGFMGDERMGREEVVGSGIALALASIAQGFLFRTIFAAFAEIIRLLRRIADKETPPAKP